MSVVYIYLGQLFFASFVFVFVFFWLFDMIKRSSDTMYFTTCESVLNTSLSSFRSPTKPAVQLHVL